MSKEMQPGEGQIILYTTPEGRARVEVFFREETFWLSQRRMADMFGVEVNTVNYHLKEIYESAELVEAATIRKFRIVQVEGGRKVDREVDFYNLAAIIAVGYRVNSRQATQFRMWATQTLREFIIKGFVLDDERLKQRSFRVRPLLLTEDAFINLLYPFRRFPIFQHLLLKAQMIIRHRGHF